MRMDTLIKVIRIGINQAFRQGDVFTTLSDFQYDKPEFWVTNNGYGHFNVLIHDTHTSTSVSIELEDS